MKHEVTESDKFLGLIRPLFPQHGVSATPLFLSKSGCNVEGSDDLIPHSCPRPAKNMVSLVHNTTAKPKLCKGFTKKSTGQQRKTETPKVFQVNGKEQQDHRSSETHRPAFSDTLFVLAHPTTREQQDIGFFETHLSVMARQLFEKKEKSERGQKKVPVRYRRRTETPTIHWDHFKEQQEFSFLETQRPVLVDTPVNLAQHKPKGPFTKLQDVSVSENVMPSQPLNRHEIRKSRQNKIANGHHRKPEKPQISPNCVKEKQDLSSSKSHLPSLVDTLNNLAQQTTKHKSLTVTPCKLFKRKENSNSGVNKIPNDHHSKTETPQSSSGSNFKKQQDVRFSETHLPPLVDGLFNLAQHTKKRIFKEQDISLKRFLPFTVTQCKLFKRKEMSRRGGNKIPVGHHKTSRTPQIWDNFQEQQDVSSSETPLGGLSMI